MGYEVLMILPLIVVVGIVVYRYSFTKKRKIVTVCVTLLCCLFFSFGYPQPFWFSREKPYIVWVGGRKSIGRLKVEKKIEDFVRKTFKLEKAW